MQTHRPVVMATRGMVASGHPLASQAGVRVLQRGGNAFDAAVGAAAAVAVCRPSANSIGADSMALIWDAQRDELTALNANGYAPAAATTLAFEDGIPRTGPRAVS